MIKKRFIFFLFPALVVCLIDCLIPRGYGVWIFYVILFAFYIRNVENKSEITPLAIIISVFTIVGYFISPPISVAAYIPIINRTIAIICIVILAVATIREKEARRLSAEILERIKDIFISLDTKLRMLFLNKNALEHLENPEEVIGKGLIEFIPTHNKPLFSSNLNRALKTKETIRFEYPVSEDTILDVSVYASDKGLSLFARDISERVRAEQKLLKLLHEKEMLMRELQHRTKNNFQLVLSLLNLQINTIRDEMSEQILRETMGRIHSISVLYDRLYSSGDSYTVELYTFISDIILNMQAASNYGLISMTNDLKIEPCRIGIESAVPVGLIINELYTNSLKYAFDGSRSSSIFVEMRFLSPDVLYVKYKDNGRGLPNNFDLENSSGLGSSIVNAFIQQLSGEIKWSNNNGAEFEITLRVTRQEAQSIPQQVS